MGYEVSKNENEVYSFVYKANGGLDVNLAHGNEIVAGMHFHTSIGDPMFSANDIYKLHYYNVANTNSYQNASDIFSVVCTEMGTFAITMSGYSVGWFVQNYPKEKLNKKLNNKYDLASKTGGNPNDYLKALISVFNDIKETESAHPPMPITLYELNQAGTEFKKISLDASNQIIKTPCN